MVPYIARVARDLKRRSYIVRVSYVGKLYLVVVLQSLHTYNDKHVALLLDCAILLLYSACLLYCDRPFRSSELHKSTVRQ